MTPEPRYMDGPADHGLTFSVCSLVRDGWKYDRLRESFLRCGFTAETTEFLAADNRSDNRLDGYSWHKTLLPEARGRYVIFCHDDVELISDGAAHLLDCLADLDRRDPSWLLAGVAGGLYRAEAQGAPPLALHISDPFGENRRRGQLPARVETLDECFILMRRARPVLSSHDLGGFHFYGPDLCLQAELLGGSAYAIDFHLRHYGKGLRGPDFRAARRAFIRKYQTWFPGRTLHCTTGSIVLAGQDQTSEADATGQTTSSTRPRA